MKPVRHCNSYVAMSGSICFIVKEEKSKVFSGKKKAQQILFSFGIEMEFRDEFWILDYKYVIFIYTVTLRWTKINFPAFFSQSSCFFFLFFFWYKHSSYSSEHEQRTIQSIQINHRFSYHPSSAQCSSFEGYLIFFFTYFWIKKYIIPEKLIRRIKFFFFFYEFIFYYLFLWWWVGETSLSH